MREGGTDTGRPAPSAAPPRCRPWKARTMRCDSRLASSMQASSDAASPAAYRAMPCIEAGASAEGGTPIATAQP